MVTIYNTTLSATSQRHFSDGLGGGRSLYEVTRKGDVFPKIHSFAPGIRHRGDRALSYLHLAYTQFLITISVLS